MAEIGPNLGHFLVHFGTIFGHFWAHFRVETLSLTCLNILAPILGPFWATFGSVFGNFGTNDCQLLVNFGYWACLYNRSDVYNRSDGHGQPAGSPRAGHGPGVVQKRIFDENNNFSVNL